MPIGSKKAFEALKAGDTIAVDHPTAGTPHRTPRYFLTSGATAIRADAVQRMMPKLEPLPSMLGIPQQYRLKDGGA